MNAGDVLLGMSLIPHLSTLLTAVRESRRGVGRRTSLPSGGAGPMKYKRLWLTSHTPKQM